MVECCMCAASVPQLVGILMSCFSLHTATNDFGFRCSCLEVAVGALVMHALPQQWVTQTLQWQELHGAYFRGSEWKT
jgi:hypothetical protein